MGQGMRGVCVKLVSFRFFFHATNYSLYTLLSYKSLPCITSFKAAASSWSPAVEQYSFGATGSWMDFCLEAREVSLLIRQYRGRAESDYFSLLSINRNAVVFLHPQERNSWCCWTSPSWWNLLWPCSAVSCGQWLLIHKVAQCLIHDLHFGYRTSPDYLNHLLSQVTTLFCLKSCLKVTDVSGIFSVDFRHCSIAISEQRGGCWASCWAEKLRAAIEPAGARPYVPPGQTACPVPLSLGPCTRSTGATNAGCPSASQPSPFRGPSQCRESGLKNLTCSLFMLQQTDLGLFCCIWSWHFVKSELA